MSVVFAAPSQATSPSNSVLEHGIPESMKAVVHHEFGGPETLSVTELPVPTPAPGEVLVRVRAVSVGRTLCVETRAGRLPFARDLTLPHVLGADHVGEVVAAAADVDAALLGRRVAVFPVVHCARCRFCLVGRTESCADLRLIGVHRQGAYARYCVVPARNVHPVPEGVDDLEACALALNGAVARRQLDLAEVTADSWVLVHGASGGLGSTLVRLASHRGARVVACSRQARKRELMAGLGADLVLDPDSPVFAETIREATDGTGVDAVVDNLVDPDLWARTSPLLAAGGTVVCSGAMAGGTAQLDLRQTYLRNQRVLGVRTARPSDVDALWRDVADGLRAVVDADSVFTLEQAADAHRHLEEAHHFGRVVLTVDD
ncbi:2-desacetyl-2-hydroxyethyl bacteriochlorophyllide A dehydrogenase [Actinoalloteichus hoggarensis]|uniref:alcohol dehydrogenase n=1 Tax=Actinoalloteichus hoggarensis TaxID=1470176 RepID=A0A221W2W0_9PSEU|nr:zinc-binding dehydrogenase [Actinoalloteichus hoggarensis]ASO20039.1 Putative L-galactonate oxidoreductase [Actinoalloteichus hoggarensis]MBB5919250.1 2-desacetyl-2-hydroxyethyl bacteriochlorophyllide A dehydrogenase [Actinoalloteichus hoggarensis]